MDLTGFSTDCLDDLMVAMLNGVHDHGDDEPLSHTFARLFAIFHHELQDRAARGDAHADQALQRFDDWYTRIGRSWQ